MSQPDQTPPDEVVVDVIAEHVLACCQAIQHEYPELNGPALLRFASRAVAELDLLSSTQYAPQRNRVASPLHDLADVALDRLTSALREMRVRDAVRVEGYTLEDSSAQMLHTLRKLVAHHRQMALTGERPQLIVPHSAQIRESS